MILQIISLIKKLLETNTKVPGAINDNPQDPTPEPLNEAINALINNDYLVWKKGDLKHLSQHVLSSEVECRRCDIGEEQKISRILLEKFELVRTDFGHPIRITSAYRCPKHNAQIGGAKLSQHIYGNALDLQPQTFNNSNQLYSLYKSCEKYFSSIGDARKRSNNLLSNFVHVDTRSGQRRWTY